MKLSERNEVTGGPLATDYFHFIRSNGDSPETYSSYKAPLSDLPNSGPVASQTFMLTGLIETAADGDYRIAANIPFAMTITKVTTRSASGTCTLTTKINTTALGGTANSVSTSEQSQTHASSNAASAGDDIVLTVSSNASATKVTVTIDYTRTLD